ncbi:CHRD domain-containing protein [Pleurocapsales cyanobacterium LEGE 10410]|nr:CHRD domain-containing protein [Pleurocapsales cyanobacterium LEGE 10410]
MVFGTILTGDQQVPADSGSSASGTIALGFDETGALTYDLTVVGLDFGAYIGEGVPQTEDTADDVTGINFGNAPIGEVGDLAFGVVGVDGNGDDDLIFTANPDGSTTISGIWEESDLANIPLSTFVPGLNSAAATTSETGSPQISDLYVSIGTVGNPEGEIRGQIASISPEISESISAIDPVTLNGLINQGATVI